MDYVGQPAVGHKRDQLADKGVVEKSSDLRAVIKLQSGGQF